MNSGGGHEHGSIDCNDWLGFSLPRSNHSVYRTSSAADGNVVEEDAAELSMMMGGGGGEDTKLEDFLGASSGSNNGTSVFEAVSNKQRRNHQKQQQHQRIYEDDLELKTFADASFFGVGNGGGCSENRDHQQQVLAIDQQHQQQALGKKTIESFGQRTSIFRGVTRHRWTGRYEAHLWDNSCRREGQSRKGRQVYLGGYDKEDKAARAYDLAALKYWGPTTTTNFPIGNYERELEEMKHMNRQEFVASLRRRSSGFSRGASMYRGVTRHHQHGRWQARIGRVAGNKDLYLGTFSTQEEAAEAYDIAAIKFRGLNAVTNFDMSRYDVKSIANSNLPIGGMSNKTKASSDSVSDSRSENNDNDISEMSVSFASPHQPINSTLNFSLPIKSDSASGYWPPPHPIHGGYINNQITLATPSPNSNPHLMKSYFHLNNTAETQYNNNMNIYCSSGSSTAGSEPGSFGNNNMIPYATPLSMTVTNVGTHEQVSISSSGSGNGNGISDWVAPNVHQYQSGKETLSVFQTPIFGIE